LAERAYDEPAVYENGEYRDPHSDTYQKLLTMVGSQSPASYMGETGKSINARHLSEPQMDRWRNISITLKTPQ
jgi:hypothetical protein